MSLNYVVKNFLSSYTSSLIVNNNFKYFLTSLPITKIDTSQRRKLQTHRLPSVVNPLLSSARDASEPRQAVHVPAHSSGRPTREEKPRGRTWQGAGGPWAFAVGGQAHISRGGGPLPGLAVAWRVSAALPAAPAHRGPLRDHRRMPRARIPPTPGCTRARQSAEAFRG